MTFRDLAGRCHDRLRTLPTALLFLTAFHLCVLALGLPYLERIPGWFFKLSDKPPASVLGAVALAALPAVTLYWVLARRGRTWIKVAALVVLGASLQHGFALLEGRGIDGMRDRMVDSGHAEFAEVAVSQASVLDVVSRYEDKLDSGELLTYPKSKPPGQLVLYVWTDRLANGGWEAGRDEERLEGLRTFASYTWPFVSYLVLVPLYLLSRMFVGERTSLLACSLFTVVPSQTLVTLHADQVFFPLFTVVCVWLATKACSAGNAALALAAGVAVYLGAFCTFPLFFALPLALATTASLHFSRGGPSRGDLIRTWLLVGAGLVVSDLVFRYAFDYDILGRVERAYTFHDEWRRKFVPSARAYFNYAFMSTLEFTVWLGIPIAGLVAYRFRRAVRDLLLGAPTGTTLPALALLLLLVYLAFFGKAKVETARLWLFLVPFCCLFAAEEIRVRFAGSFRLVTTLVVALQWSTVYLTKTKQDFF